MGDPSRISQFYRMVVMQPETLCNLDCNYCYLPQRKEQNAMRPEIAHRVAADIAAQSTKPGAPEQVIVMWHCSEPLVVPKERFVRLLAPFELLRRAGRIRHAVQTNATLVDTDWCDLLHHYDFHVTVSHDGPKDMAKNRVNWVGKPVHRQIMEGIRYLQAADLDPGVIAVVTPETVHRGREMIQFFHELGFTRIAFNMEEREGVNTDRPLIPRIAAVKFWNDVFSYIAETRAPIKLRDMGILSRFERGETAPERDSIPTITWEGNIVLAAPELAGMKDERYHDFVAANILQESIQSVLGRVHGIPYIRDFEDGLSQCKAHCSYWNACHGGYASNRWSEHGRLDIMETNHCQVARQAPVEALHQIARRQRDTRLEAGLAPLIPLSRRNA